MVTVITLRVGVEVAGREGDIHGIEADRNEQLCS